jgi:hypothetical protein
MRRWKIGRDAIKRIMTNLIRTGWCCAQKTRLSNGTFQIVYEIRDEPGRELTEEEVRGALSLVSSEAAEAETDGETAADHLRETGDPPTGQPGVDDQGVVTSPWPRESLQNPESQRTESTQTARAFADVREQWPPDHILSIVACENHHLALTDPDKEAAFRGSKPYLDDCRAQNRKVCDLATYYRERRWERFTVKATAPSFYVVQRGTPQAMRWREWYAAHEPTKIAVFDLAVAGGHGYTTPTEWPPPKGAVLSDQDASDFVDL